jgi:hypothetical protein
MEDYDNVQTSRAAFLSSRIHAQMASPLAHGSPSCEADDLLCL